MKIGTLCKIIYGCIAGRFIQKVVSLLTSNNASLHGGEEIVGLFAIFNNPVSSISPTKYLLIGTTEYGKIIRRDASIIYDILADATVLNGYSFDHLSSISQNAFPIAYTCLSNAPASQLIYPSTQKALFRAFKELTA
jgi:hypothetical protein